MVTRCIECDIIMEDKEWKAHKETLEHFRNIQVNIVVRTMTENGLDLKDLVRILKKRKKTKSTAGEMTIVMNVHQRGAMRTK